MNHLLTRVEAGLVLVAVVIATTLVGLSGLPACSAAQQAAETNALDKAEKLCGLELFDGAAEGYVCAAVDLLDGAVHEVTGGTKAREELTKPERAAVAKLALARGATRVAVATVAPKGAQ